MHQHIASTHDLDLYDEKVLYFTNFFFFTKKIMCNSKMLTCEIRVKIFCEVGHFPQCILMLDQENILCHVCAASNLSSF